MFTPWGMSDSQVKLMDGVYWTGTPSHGGLMVGSAVAKKHLSDYTISQAQACGTFLAFEEDCAWNLPAFEWAELRDAMDNSGNFLSPCDITKIATTIARWYPDYFKSVRIIPVAAC